MADVDVTKLTIEELRFELAPLAHVIAKRVAEGGLPAPATVEQWRRLNAELESRGR